MITFNELQTNFPKNLHPIGFLPILLSLILLTNYTSLSQKWTTQKGGHCYTMEIPDYLVRAFDLNDVASLQYKNESKEAYVIVIEDDKEHLQSLGMKFVDPEDFLEHFLRDYKNEESGREFSKVINFTANGNEHSQVEMSWDQDDLGFFMLVTAVETKNHYYKILCWTLKQNATILKDDFKKIAKSLKD